MKKMGDVVNGKAVFMKKFVAELGDLCKEEVLKPCLVLGNPVQGQGDLEEGIRTTMRLGDLELIGPPENAPEEAAVNEDYDHFYKGREMAPLVKLLPTLTLTGTEDTKPGAWKLLYESDKSRLWAFLRMLRGMQTEMLSGVEAKEERFAKIMGELLQNVPVVLMKFKAMDELWEDWSKSQEVGHTYFQHSVDRGSVRFTFFSKMKQNLKAENAKTGIGKDITGKELFHEYMDAEAKKKFKIAKGMMPVRRENELSQLMKWGETMAKFGLMPAWCHLEVVMDGKTAFFNTAFANGFCALVENDQAIAEYVIGILTWALSQEDSKTGSSWKKRVVEATVPKMKGIVKTLVLQWNWAKQLFRSCAMKSIGTPEKMREDFTTIEVVFSLPKAIAFKTDSTGKKANLHPLFLELWETCCKVLVDQAHFCTFQSAEAMNKNFQNTCKIESLENLCVANICNPWKDAHVAYEGLNRTNESKNNDDDEEMDGTEKIHALPTREEALKVASKGEVALYHGTSFTKTGDIARDREKLANCELTKPRRAQDAQYNTETKGNRRVSFYDEPGRRNPKWTYVKGRNEYRSKVSFQKDDFEDFADTWCIMAKPGEVPVKEGIDVLSVWNAEQEKASGAILKKMKLIPGLDGRIKKTTLKGLQEHVERRLWDGSPDCELGELDGLPGMREESFEAYAGPLPTRRQHLEPLGGIKDNLYPEEIIPLRNPKKSEPRVTVEVQKAIFPPDEDKPDDGDKVVRSDEVWTPTPCARLCSFSTHIILAI